MQHMLRIEWMPNSPSGRQWWVYSYPCGADGLMLKGGNVPTANIIGQYESIEAAKAAHPTAQMYEVTSSPKQTNKYRLVDKKNAPS
jgi:hypothetical protein